MEIYTEETHPRNMQQFQRFYSITVHIRNLLGPNLWISHDWESVVTRHSGQVGQRHTFTFLGSGLPVLHVILALIRVTYQFANNVIKYKYH